MKLSIGWFDLGTFIGDPGLEHKEDLESVPKPPQPADLPVLQCFPIPSPCVQTKNEISY